MLDGMWLTNCSLLKCGVVFLRPARSDAAALLLEVQGPTLWCAVTGEPNAEFLTPPSAPVGPSDF